MVGPARCRAGQPSGEGEEKESDLINLERRLTSLTRVFRIGTAHNNNTSNEMGSIGVGVVERPVDHRRQSAEIAAGPLLPSMMLSKRWIRIFISPV